MRDELGILALTAICEMAIAKGKALEEEFGKFDIKEVIQLPIPRVELNRGNLLWKIRPKNGQKE